MARGEERGAGDMTRVVERVSTPPFLIHVVNPVMKRLLASPLHGPLSRGLMVLHVTGRKSGKTYDVVVGRHVIDGRLYAHANGGWRVNLRGGAEITLTLDGTERRGHAVLVEDRDQVTDIVMTLLERLGPNNAARIGLRVNVDRMPTREEVRDGIRGDAYALITLRD